MTYSRTVPVDLYTLCYQSEKSYQKQTVAQNKFQEGDLVFYDAGPKPHPKMASRHSPAEQK
jgi:hypothetical protein